MNPLLLLALLTNNDDDRLAILLGAYYEGLLKKAHIVYQRLDIESLSDDEFRKFFRFARADIGRLATSLRVPENLELDPCYKVSGQEGLLILLRRLAYPSRYCDLANVFGRSPAALSMIFKCMLNHIHANFHHLLEFDHPRLTPQYLEMMCAFNRTKGSALRDCAGFIDGTTISICRPGIDQEEYYSGHKRTHCLKFQNVLFPDGIIVFMDGAHMGSRHDAGMFRYSELPRILRRHLRGD